GVAVRVGLHDSLASVLSFAIKYPAFETRLRVCGLSATTGAEYDRRPQEGCESGRIGTLGKRVWGNSPWVRIPLPPHRCDKHNMAPSVRRREHRPPRRPCGSQLLATRPTQLAARADREGMPRSRADW